ncbi:hypothetical protein KC356_g346 [Hortaea werneckii]|nr:hypothetical protein KC356_g346 [Hortaea werneckii]
MIKWNPNGGIESSSIKTMTMMMMYLMPTALILPWDQIPHVEKQTNPVSLPPLQPELRSLVGGRWSVVGDSKKASQKKKNGKVHRAGSWIYDTTTLPLFFFFCALFQFLILTLPSFSPSSSSPNPSFQNSSYPYSVVSKETEKLKPSLLTSYLAFLSSSCCSSCKAARSCSPNFSPTNRAMRPLCLASASLSVRPTQRLTSWTSGQGSCAGRLQVLSWVKAAPKPSSSTSRSSIVSSAAGGKGGLIRSCSSAWHVMVQPRLLYRSTKAWLSASVRDDLRVDGCEDVFLDAVGGRDEEVGAEAFVHEGGDEVVEADEAEGEVFGFAVGEAGEHQLEHGGPVVLERRDGEVVHDGLDEVHGVGLIGF